MGQWFKTKQWDVWLDIYCDYKLYNIFDIKRNFENIRRKSLRYVNSKIKEFNNK